MTLNPSPTSPQPLPLLLELWPQRAWPTRPGSPPRACEGRKCPQFLSLCLGSQPPVSLLLVEGWEGEEGGWRRYSSPPHTPPRPFPGDTAYGNLSSYLQMPRSQ